MIQTADLNSYKQVIERYIRDPNKLRHEQVANHLYLSRQFVRCGVAGTLLSKCIRSQQLCVAKTEDIHSFQRLAMKIFTGVAP